MRRKATLFIAYSPVILLAGQMAANILYFIDSDFYYTKGYYLNTMFGGSFFIALLLVCLTFTLRFCAVSKWAALAQLLFAILAFIIKDDNVYNISLQLIIGATAMFLTFKYYVSKFPLCRLSVWSSFLFSLLLKGGDCEKAIDRFEQALNNKVAANHDNK